MTPEQMIKELKRLADGMYHAAFNMSTDASQLRKAMNEYNRFIWNEYSDYLLTTINNN